MRGENIGARMYEERESRLMAERFAMLEKVTPEDVLQAQFKEFVRCDPVMRAREEKMARARQLADEAVEDER